MKGLLLSLRFGLLVALMALVVAGCSKNSFKTEPVSGKVTVDNTPLTGGNVTFHPTTEDKSKAGLSAGQIDSNGNYKIFTGGKEGVPPGKYKVTVTPPMVPMSGATSMPKAEFADKFRDSKTTPLEITVPGGSYDLKLTKS